VATRRPAHRRAWALVPAGDSGTKPTSADQPFAEERPARGGGLCSTDASDPGKNNPS
jgi:hypothetical protein